MDASIIKFEQADGTAFGEFAICLEIPGLVGRVLQDNVAFRILVISEAKEDDIALINPDLSRVVSSAPSLACPKLFRLRHRNSTSG